MMSSALSEKRERVGNFAHAPALFFYLSVTGVACTTWLVIDRGRQGAGALREGGTARGRGAADGRRWRACMGLSAARALLFKARMCVCGYAERLKGLALQLSWSAGAGGDAEEARSKFSCEREK